MQFKISDLTSALQHRDPAFADLASFATREQAAASQALAELYATYRQNNNPWARASTFSGSPDSTGTTPAMATTVGDVYVIAMTTGRIAVAGDTIFLYKTTTSTFIPVPRSTIELVLISGTATTEVFWENHGEIVLYSKTGDFTAPASVHYDYWRDPVIDCTTTTNVIDIDPIDFTTFVDSVYSLLTQS